VTPRSSQFDLRLLKMEYHKMNNEMLKLQPHDEANALLSARRTALVSKHDKNTG